MRLPSAIPAYPGDELLVRSAACTGFANAKRQVGDLPLLVEVGRLELHFTPSGPCQIGAPIGI
jgi:hypothetical protein